MCNITRSPEFLSSTCLKVVNYMKYFKQVLGDLL